MNKKNMKKELRRLEKRDTELNNEIRVVRAELEQANEQLEQANGQNKALNEQIEQANEQLEQANEQLEQANEQLEQLNEQNKEVNKKQDVIEKLQKEQGLDIAALQEALDDLEDKTGLFEDEYEDYMNKYNSLLKIKEENPELAEGINLNPFKEGMESANNSQDNIKEEVNEGLKLMREGMAKIIKFSKNNYNNL